MSVVSSHLVAAAPDAGTLLGAGDAGSSRTVYAMVAGLVAIGIALVLLGVWILRKTRPDLEVLAPLERMGDGAWRKRDPATQRRMLDQLRPDGAQPLSSEPMPPPIDADFGSDHPVTSFSDLGPGLVAGEHESAPVETVIEQRDPTPVDAEAAMHDPTKAAAAADGAEPDDAALSDPHG